MDSAEHLYRLSDLELALLLALLENRPPMVLGLGARGNAGQEEWEQCALSLVQMGWLSRADARLVPGGKAEAILKGMQRAPCSEIIYSKQGDSTVKQLFWARHPILLELCGSHGYRLRQYEELSCTAWQNLLGLPIPLGGLPVWAQGLQRQALPIEEPAIAWGKVPQTNTIADLYNAAGTLIQRRVWLADTDGTAILVQVPAETVLLADTEQDRAQLYALGRNGEIPI